METKSGAEKEEKLEFEKRGQIENVYIHSIVVKRLQRELLSFYALISLKINWNAKKRPSLALSSTSKSNKFLPL